MNTYNIETAFTRYLLLVKLDINTMSETQIIETKRAFFGGCAYMFRAMESTAQLNSEDEAIYLYRSFENQISQYFKEEITKPSNTNNHDTIN